MEKYTTLLEETLESWVDVREGIIAEVENIPENQFDYRPNPETRSVKEQVVHILEVALLMVGELTREDTNFKRSPWPELLKIHAGNLYEIDDRNELLALLKSQLEDGIAKFKAAGELHMLQFIERFDGKQGTRLAWLQHGVAQEMYHRGQLTVYQRLMGIEPALTKKIRGG